MIDDIIKGLRELDFPKIGFLDSISIIQDGGKEQVDSYTKSKSDKKAKEEGST